MARFGVVRRGLMPYLVVSQTVPMIALAPLVVSWGGRLHIGSWEWPRWLSVAVLGAFLAFFPVAVGTLRGLESASATSLELMRSFAATNAQTMRKLRFPAAVPHMVPALKLAATASVIGVVVAEISTGLRGGVGRLIIEYARQASSDPAKMYTALLGAAVLGLAMVGVVAAFEAARDPQPAAGRVVSERASERRSRSPTPGRCSTRARRRQVDALVDVDLTSGPASSSASSGRRAAASRRCCG